MKEIGGGDGYLKTISEDVKLLKQYGVDDNLIKLSHSNIPENNDLNYLKNRSIEEKIIHFVDMVISGAELVSISERYDILEKKSKNIEFSESFRDKYNGNSLFEVQREVAAIEQEEFEKTLNLQPGTLIDFIKEKLEERIKNYE